MSARFGLFVAILCVGCASSPPVAKPIEPILGPDDLAARVDIPLYPKAEIPDGRSRAPHTDDAGSTRYELIQTTKDPVAKIVRFYQEKLKLEAGKGTNPVMLMGQSPKGNYLMIRILPEKGSTMIQANAITPRK